MLEDWLLRNGRGHLFKTVYKDLVEKQTNKQTPIAFFQERTENK